MDQEFESLQREVVRLREEIAELRALLVAPHRAIGQMALSH